MAQFNSIMEPVTDEESFTPIFIKNLNYFIENEIIHLYAENIHGKIISGKDLEEEISNDQPFTLGLEFNHSNPLVQKVIENFKKHDISYKTSSSYVSHNYITYQNYETILLKFPSIAERINKFINHKCFFGSSYINQFKISHLENENTYYPLMSTLLLLYLKQDDSTFLKKYSDSLFEGFSYLHDKHFDFLSLIYKNILSEKNQLEILNQIITEKKITPIFYNNDHSFNNSAISFCKKFKVFGDDILYRILETAFSHQHNLSSTYNRRILDTLQILPSDEIRILLDKYCQFSINELDNISLDDCPFESSCNHDTSVHISLSELQSKYSQFISLSEMRTIFANVEFHYKMTQDDINHFFVIRHQNDLLNFSISSKFYDKNIDFKVIDKIHTNLQKTIPVFLHKFIVARKAEMTDSSMLAEDVDKHTLFEESLSQVREKELVDYIKNNNQKNNYNNSSPTISKKI